MARELGFPVVMKATRPGLVHKSELGGVRLGLSNESAVREAYLAIARSLDETEPQVALQRMVPDRRGAGRRRGTRSPLRLTRHGRLGGCAYRPARGSIIPSAAAD